MRAGAGGAAAFGAPGVPAAAADGAAGIAAGEGTAAGLDAFEGPPMYADIKLVPSFGGGTLPLLLTAGCGGGGGGGGSGGGGGYDDGECAADGVAADGDIGGGAIGAAGANEANETGEPANGGGPGDTGAALRSIAGPTPSSKRARVDPSAISSP